MNSNPVVNCTLIVRSQAEYSLTTHTIMLRCLLENVATGQRRGFTNLDTMLLTLRAELIELQSQIIPLEAPKSKELIAADTTPLPSDATAGDIDNSQ